MIQPAARSHFSELLDAGVKIYLWQGEMLHAKTATIDGVWSTVGSSNLDWWSIARNDEINTVVLSVRFGQEMNASFMRDLQNSQATRFSPLATAIGSSSESRKLSPEVSSRCCRPPATGKPVKIT